MNTVTGQTLAKRLGVSLPTMHRILDREGVPRTGSGIPRYVGAQQADRIVRSRAPSLGVARTRVLAALRARHHGIESARQVARVAGVSPATAAAALQQFMGAGLVRREDVRTLSGGAVTARRMYRLNTAHRDWPLMRSAVDAVLVPEPAPQRSARVPKQFWHLFWNVEPSELRIEEHGAFIAKRMIGSANLAAAVWALDNVPQACIEKSIAGRGIDARTKAFAANYLKSA